MDWLGELGGDVVEGRAECGEFGGESSPLTRSSESIGMLEWLRARAS